MNEESLQELKRRAGAAFKARDFELTYNLSEQLTHHDVASAFFTCGLIVENGWINGVKDLDQALFFYRNLAIKFNDEEGYLGCVRIFLARQDVEKRELAIRYCLGAKDGRLKHLAFLLLGRVYEDLHAPPNYALARKAYWTSFCAGSAWALRQYAMSLMKSKNFIGSILMHIVATIASLIFVLARGLRVTRHG